MTIFGPDGSRWQAGIRLAQADWDAVGFLIWRASSTYIDPTYAWARQQAAAHGKPFLAYHALYGPHIRSLETQADTFHQATGTGMRCMIDWEGWEGGTQGCTFDQVLRFKALLEARGHESTVIYTFGAFWQQQGRPTMAGHGFDLGMARYGAQSPIGEYEIRDRYADMMAAGTSVWGRDYGGLHPVLWQFGSRIRWGDRFMDMNAYNGRVQDLDQWFVMPPGFHRPPPAPSPPPVPPLPIPTPDEEDDDMAKHYIVLDPRDGMTQWLTDGATFKKSITDPAQTAQGPAVFGWVSGGPEGYRELDPAWATFLDQLPTI